MKAAKTVAQEQLRDAWAGPPVTNAGQMNLGDIYPGDVSLQCKNYVTAVRRKLGLSEGDE